MAEAVRAQSPWKVTVLAGMASYLDACALVLNGTIVSVLYAGPLQLSPTSIGLIVGSSEFTFAIGALFGGRAGDKFGRKRVFTVSLMLYAIGVAMQAAATTTWPLLLGSIIAGLAVGADLPVSLSMINEEAPEGQKGKMVAFSQVFWTIGLVVTYLLTAWLSQYGATGGRIMYAHLVVVALVVLALRWTLRESVEWESYSGKGSAARSNADEGGGMHYREIRQLFQKPIVFAVMALALFYTAWGLGNVMLGGYGTYIWVHLGHGKVASISLLSAAINVFLGIGMALFSRVTDRPSRRVWIGIGAAVNLVGWGLPVIMGPSIVALLVLNISLIGNAAFGEVVYKVWSQERVPTMLRGTSQGVTIGVARAIMGLFSFAIPAMLVADARALFGVLFGLMCAAVVIGLVWVPRLRHAREIEEPPVVVSDDGKANATPSTSE